MIVAAAPAFHGVSAEARELAKTKKMAISGMRNRFMSANFVKNQAMRRGFYVTHSVMLFEETKTVWWSQLLWAIAVGDVILGVYLWQQFDAAAASNPLAWFAIVLVVVTLIALVIAAIAFAKYSVTFDGERLSFGFSKLNGYVPVETIESIEIIQHVNLLKFGGVGWRFDFGGKKIGFLANKGSVIEVTPKGGSWRYVFNCEDTERLAAFLEKAGIGMTDEADDED